MIIEDKIQARELKSINEKLDYLINKFEYTEEILIGLVNITLDPPPNSIPETPIKENESEAIDDRDTYAVDPGAIRPCLYRYVYIWPSKGNGFWAWLTFVGRSSVAGYRWTGQRWVYFGIDRKRQIK